MAYPKTDRATRLRIVKSRNGVMVYGNKSAFRTLARWMSWLGDSAADEHYEVHIPWHLQSPFAKNNRVEIFNESGKGGLKRNHRFEITFMVLNQTEISRVRERTSGAQAKKRAR
jgi:hypothetical protein